MDFLEQFGSLKGAFEVQKFMDTYGIVLEDFQESKGTGLFSSPEYRIKFSTPEFWENRIIFDENLQGPDRLASVFKSKVNDALVEIWKETDAGYDDDFYKECIECFTYLCRTRKGETWTCENRDNALSKTNSAIEKASESLKQSTEYEEV